ncbi:unnamed protein product [Rotaria socialis]|uniref:Uncharacterized protein n=2 Tax=Rotaria socialis TaxID=392032 RepID=A0A821KF11_9BILA|nr:unnamed protein product [Rotaria socialis]
MTRFEEKLYLQNVFDAIDQVYKMKKSQQNSSYEERLRASFNKLIVPDWYNHDYTSMNGLRKTKSHGHVPRAKRVNKNNNNTNNDDTPDISVSSSTHSPHLPNGTYRPSYRHQSPSRSWSEKTPLRRDSTASSYDTTTSVINGRRSVLSNGSASYAPGLQRVAQSSTWYKPNQFATKPTNGTTNGHSLEPPKPRPRYSKIDPGRINSSDSSSSSSSSTSSSLSTKSDNARHPIKPRTMAQPQIPIEESILDVSSEADVTIVPQSPTEQTIGNSASTHVVETVTTTNMFRTNSLRSVTSEAESYRSAVLPSTDKNLLGTDSSSYASVAERCLSPSTASYHTARLDDTSSSSSSMTGYETPTPQLHDEHETLSSHSSLSDLSHAETLEPNAEDLDIVALSTVEQKSDYIPSADVEMENSSLPSLTSTSSNTGSLATSGSRPSDNQHWYDGSLETCIHQTGSNQIESLNIREISNDEILREVDINAVGDEFFLFSPHNSAENELLNSPNDEKQNENIQILNQQSNRIFAMEDKTTNMHNSFLYSSSNDPFDFDDDYDDDDNNNNNNSSIMITNLDDILIDDNENGDSTNQFLGTNYRRPIQEDILYEVEHENSLSDHSQNTSSIIATNDTTSIKTDINTDYLTTTDSPSINNNLQTSIIENEKPTSSPSTTATVSDNTVLPIYILPPLYTTSTQPSTSLHINTNDTIPKWESSLCQYSDLSSPSIYTPKIRHRQYSVGSYYDHKTTTVTLTPNYFLGSAPVSPLSRASTTSSESHYHIHQHHSPTTYDNVSVNALRRVNPFFESNAYTTIIETNDSHSAPLSNREDRTQIITFTSPTTSTVEKTIPTTENELKPTVPSSVVPPTATRTSSVIFSQFEVPNTRPKPMDEIPASRLQSIPFKQESSSIQHNYTYDSPSLPTVIKKKPSLVHQNATYESSTLPFRPSLFEQESSIVRSLRNRPVPFVDQTKSITEESSTQHIYQDIDSTLKTINQSQTINADLQFIRGAIERVLDFHHDSTLDTPPSESSTHYDEVLDENLNPPKKTSVQYPAVEAVQRFYNHKISTDLDKRNPIEQVTNLDDIVVSSSSISQKQSPAVPARRRDLTKVILSGSERASSDEVDDTLNDIEDAEYQEEKLKRQKVNNHHHTDSSTETSPLRSANSQAIERRQPSNLTKRSVVPPIDITTEMVIEQDDIVGDNGIIDDSSSDMVIFYDDIEIVEHLSSCSSESDSVSSSSSSSSSHHYSKPKNASIIQPPPPIPARTLKPSHLINDNNNEQQSSSSSSNAKVCELDKFAIRKKFDINTVNDMLNRTDNNLSTSSVTHRHPSARHFVGKLNNDDASTVNTKPVQPVIINGHGNGNEYKRPSMKTPFATLPSRSSSAASKSEKHRSIIADTNALVKHIQNSLSRNSLHDAQTNSKSLSSSTKDLRAFVSSTYSPSDENIIDDNGAVHLRQPTNNNNNDDQSFKRQARLSKSFHNVSEYKSTDQYPKNNTMSTPKTLPSKSVEHSLNQVSQNQTKPSHIPLNLTSVVTRTSSSALQNSDETTRMLSMKWYTGQVNENSEISYHAHHTDADDLLYGYVSTHSNRELQALLARLQASHDPRIHAALDDIRSRVAQFDASKTREDLHVFMRYLESRLRDLNNKKSSSKTILHDEMTNGHQQSDSASVKSRSTSTSNNDSNKETSSSSRQLGRQHLRSSTSTGSGINGHQPIPSRRSSQSSNNQENPVMFDEMLNTVLGLSKKGISALPQAYPYKYEKPAPLVQTQLTTNTTALNKNGRDIGKRLFESGTFKDPRLIYDKNTIVFSNSQKMASGATAVTGSKLQLHSYLSNNNIEGFAIKNFRERYLIPSSNNYFGGIQIEYILIDSGSSSSLFPLPMLPNKVYDIDALLKNFPYDKYIWSIGTAYGVGLLADTTLQIKPKESSEGVPCTIQCSLHTDIESLEFQLPYVRFSLDRESITILTQRIEISLSETDKETLENAVNFFNEFEKHFPSMRNTKKREYCLLGQHFLKNLCTIQINDTMLFIDRTKLNAKLFPPAHKSINEIADFLHFQRPSFAKAEKFLVCEDDEHGGRDLLNIFNKIIDIDEC